MRVEVVILIIRLFNPHLLNLIINNTITYSYSFLQIESGHSDLGTLANVVTSLANLSDSLKDNLNNCSTSDSQQEEQSASDITRSEQITWYTYYLEN